MEKDIRISIDDGDVLDKKSAELLTKYNLVNETCFYVTPFYPNKSREDQWKVQDLTRELSKQGFEIGGHTFTHCVIRYECYTKKIEEINSGKEFLEDLINKKINKFAYPKGYLDDECIKAIKACGFKEARTMQTGAITIRTSDPFALPVTVHFYPERYLKFKELLEAGDYFHLVFHSWEIEKFGLWEKLENHLKILSEYKNTISK